MCLQYLCSYGAGDMHRNDRDNERYCMKQFVTLESCFWGGMVEFSRIGHCKGDLACPSRRLGATGDM